jgi:hypothetical protein
MGEFGGGAAGRRGGIRGMLGGPNRDRGHSADGLGWIFNARSGNTLLAYYSCRPRAFGSGVSRLSASANDFS